MKNSITFSTNVTICNRFKDGNVTKSTGTPHTFDGDQWVLVVKGLVHEDGGFYTCQVKNSAGKISFRYKLNVYSEFKSSNVNFFPNTLKSRIVVKYCQRVEATYFIF